MITGAGGSVGAELARQLAECDPAEIVLFDQSEYGLFTTAQELENGEHHTLVRAVLGDVSRAHDIAPAVDTHQPHFVFHAAACKHVTVAERSIVPAARTNVLGAVRTAQAAKDAGARFILISTDKAAQPQSVMGATKRMAELAVQQVYPRGAVAVRFGNVLGSSGSVVEVLLEAARTGRPVAVTDPEATRFFMTAAEAVTLVLKAAVLGRPKEIFWLDMGRPIRLGDLVERVLDVATPPGATRVRSRVVGLRPGEKQHEAPMTQGVTVEPTSDSSIWRARQPRVHQDFIRDLEQMRRACAVGDGWSALTALSRAVPGYRASAQARAAAAATTPLAGRAPAVSMARRARAQVARLSPPA